MLVNSKNCHRLVEHLARVSIESFGKNRAGKWYMYMDTISKRERGNARKQQSTSDHARGQKGCFFCPTSPKLPRVTKTISLLILGYLQAKSFLQWL